MSSSAKRVRVVEPPQPAGGGDGLAHRLKPTIGAQRRLGIEVLHREDRSLERAVVLAPLPPRLGEHPVEEPAGRSLARAGEPALGEHDGGRQLAQGERAPRRLGEIGRGGSAEAGGVEVRRHDERVGLSDVLEPARDELVRSRRRLGRHRRERRVAERACAERQLPNAGVAADRVVDEPLAPHQLIGAPIDDRPLELQGLGDGVHVAALADHRPDEQHLSQLRGQRGEPRFVQGDGRRESRHATASVAEQPRGLFRDERVARHAARDLLEGPLGLLGEHRTQERRRRSVVQRSQVDLLADRPFEVGLEPRSVAGDRPTDDRRPWERREDRGDARERGLVRELQVLEDEQQRSLERLCREERDQRELDAISEHPRIAQGGFERGVLGREGNVRDVPQRARDRLRRDPRDHGLDAREQPFAGRLAPVDVEPREAPHQSAEQAEGDEAASRIAVAGVHREIGVYLGERAQRLLPHAALSDPRVTGERDHRGVSGIERRGRRSRQRRPFGVSPDERGHAAEERAGQVEGVALGADRGAPWHRDLREAARQQAERHVVDEDRAARPLPRRGDRPFDRVGEAAWPRVDHRE
jgi:hypothetical protein